VPHNPYALPADLPVPVDDGAATHLPAQRIPSVTLPATDGTEVDLSAVRGRVVVFAYPRTGRPGQPPLVPDWDSIPGARGCTPQTCAFRDLAAEFGALGCRVFGLSTQEPADQRELTEQLHLPFPVLSDAELRLTRALRLPTFSVAGHVLLKRLTWVQLDGVIEHVFYPVFRPDRNAADVLAWLQTGLGRHAGGTP
jgi:peroxiredoxin